jgi:AcrR family transcriptional regulator
MSGRPFHHGNLRAALLDQAELVLRERGIDALSLRELARDVGVSHGAPRSHFVDRKALLDALAERGYLRLTDRVQAVVAERRGDGFAATVRAVARVSLEFATSNPALLDLMFAAKTDQPSAHLAGAAERLFGTLCEIAESGVEAGLIQSGEVEQAALLWSSLVQGVSALVTSRRATVEQAEAVIDHAVARFAASGGRAGS